MHKPPPSISILSTAVLIQIFAGIADAAHYQDGILEVEYPSGSKENGIYLASPEYTLLQNMINNVHIKNAIEPALLSIINNIGVNGKSLADEYLPQISDLYAQYSGDGSDDFTMPSPSDQMDIGCHAACYSNCHAPDDDEIGSGEDEEVDPDDPNLDDDDEDDPDDPNLDDDDEDDPDNPNLDTGDSGDPNLDDTSSP
ncbi:hypothetical protein [Flexibacterium corallicola]|uniref:hypothetical protein n=1 Tax=Flexibacterium corallicola TaxID=3037259 RepID=UPI00286ECAD9|nr:hypothetical protein [Pseudovibrio sp. M1P-2-3]